jgi:glycosyltransferase involved in cell wall biosynthesis
MGEAMQASKPIIAFRLASIPDLVVDNFTGCLAKPVSARDLASKTMNLITDEEKARAMGDNARETVKELYSAEAVGVVMEGLLKEV